MLARPTLSTPHFLASRFYSDDYRKVVRSFHRLINDNLISSLLINVDTVIDYTPSSSTNRPFEVDKEKSWLGQQSRRFRLQIILNRPSANDQSSTYSFLSTHRRPVFSFGIASGLDLEEKIRDSFARLRVRVVDMPDISIPQARRIAVDTTGAQIVQEESPAVRRSFS